MTRRLGTKTSRALLCYAALGACQGRISSSPSASGAGEPEFPGGAIGEPAGANVVPRSGARRLSRNEYDNTLRDLLGDTTRAATRRLPEDVTDPFDNDYTTQVPSRVLVEAVEALAEDVATRLIADTARRDQVVGCVPAGLTDLGCLRRFVTTFGKRALRRPLTPAEIDRYLELGGKFADGEMDFYAGIEVVLRAFLVDPELLYRMEIGASVPGHAGLYRLDDWEMASRLSFFLWGGPPDDTLFALAEEGKLRAVRDVRAVAQRMLQDPRAADRIDRFHAMWLGYYVLPHPPALTAQMREETASLLRQVLFAQRRPWSDLFRWPETFIGDTLAQLYGLPSPGPAPRWVPYGSTGRLGLLSQGSFLAAGGFAGDTSPTRRGKHIRVRLLCENIPPPPPDVKTDAPPRATSSPCKWDRYAAHRSNGMCKGCHDLIDPLGFGLENYDTSGRYRSHDEGHPECVVEGKGEIVGAGTFTGPGQLGQLLVEKNLVGPCLIRQLWRFANGRPESRDELLAIDALAGRFREGGERFDALLLDIVSREAFGYRQEE